MPCMLGQPVSLSTPTQHKACADLEKKIQRGSKFDKVFFSFFFLVEGIEVPNTAIKGPTLARQRNAIQFKWRFAGVPMTALL